MEKICFLTTIPLTMECFVLDYAKALAATGEFEVFIITSYSEALADKIPVNLTYIPLNMKRGMSFSFLFSIIKLSRILRQEKITIMCYSTPNASLIGAVAGYITKVPKRIYGQWGIRYIGLKSWKRSLIKLVEKITCYLSTHVRPVSEKNRAFAIDEKLYGAEKSLVVGRGGTIGVNLSRYDITKKENWKLEIRKKYQIKDQFVFGYVGRLTEEKGIYELLEAFRRLEENLKGKIKLLLVGSIDDQKLEQSFEPYFKESNIVYTGKVNSNEIERYFAALDCLVHPTYREGFGMVLQEAGAMGVPTITTNIIGASEVFPEDCCMLVDVKDVESLYQKMLFATGNSHTLEKIGRSARKYTEQFYERERMVQQKIHDLKSINEGNVR